MDRLEVLNTQLEILIAQAQGMAEQMEMADPNAADPQFLHRQMSALAHSHVTVLRHMGVICALMACLRDGVEIPPA